MKLSTQRGRGSRSQHSNASEGRGQRGTQGGRRGARTAPDSRQRSGEEQAGRRRSAGRPARGAARNPVGEQRGQRAQRGDFAEASTRSRFKADRHEHAKPHTDQLGDSQAAATDTSVIAGRHPVLEAIKSGRSINKVLVAEGAEGGSLPEVLGKAKAAGLVVQTVPRQHLDTIAGTNHQGVVAYAAAHDYVDLDDLVQRDTGQPPLVLLLDEVADPYNLGAILRTAEGAAAQGVVIPKRRAVPLTETVGKAAAGALEYVPVARVANLVQAMEQLKRHNYWIVGTDIDAELNYTEVDYRGPIAVVIGAEGKGLSRLVREKCDYLVSLPMLGQLQSLNASVATGVLLYEIIRQRR